MRPSTTFLVASISLQTDFNLKNSGRFFWESPTHAPNSGQGPNITAKFSLFWVYTTVLSQINSADMSIRTSFGKQAF